MWIFTGSYLKDFFIVAPRAPHVSAHPRLDGYSWVEKPSKEQMSFAEIQPSLGLLENLIAELAANYRSVDFNAIRMVGFSQGAALSYAYLLRYPHRVERLAALAGFMPAGSMPALSDSQIVDKPVFIAHGTEDEAVPYAKAELAYQQLSDAGAAAQLCVSEVGHKLGSNCLKQFKAFITQ